MSRRKLAVRRLQQLFIICSVTSLAFIVACSSSRSFSIRNDLDQEISVSIEDFAYSDTNKSLAAQLVEYPALNIGPRTTIANHYMIGEPGDFNRYGILLTTETDEYYFWVDTDAILKTKCQIIVSKLMIEFLSINPTSQRDFHNDSVIIEDAIILNPNYRNVQNRDCQ